MASVKNTKMRGRLYHIYFSDGVLHGRFISKDAGPYWDTVLQSELEEFMRDKMLINAREAKTEAVRNAEVGHYEVIMSRIVESIKNAVAQGKETIHVSLSEHDNYATGGSLDSIAVSRVFKELTASGYKYKRGRFKNRNKLTISFKHAEPIMPEAPRPKHDKSR